ncbi:hypothetical protein Y600_5505 [Burkholderia pseudomallei MSHR3709]|nr:hypothetical protein Y600_5505 [Burkholderia pseudomallei MSHR3709]
MKSYRFVITWKIDVKIREPPGVPITSATLPSFVRTVGDIDDSGRFFGSIAFASLPTTPNMLATPGFAEKSSISSLSTMPVPSATTPEPK